MCSLVPPAHALVAEASASVTRSIAGALARFGDGAIAFAHARGIRIIPLAAAQRYRDASAALRRLGADVDAWPVPPAGLFVVEERAVYLRSATPMTVAHEFAHGLDCALGDGVYRSGYDSAVRAAFARARTFVTPYAATGLDEYFAESLRAYVEVNDPHSPWPKATRERLLAIDGPMYDFTHELFTTVLSPMCRAQ
ncbi:MAG: hypothetical protein M3R44_01005 [Candidatus Eremiobacteraeota bacterium]|nr:hypothetical protein [Candidatus Eremiobacteraeota bacterium]